MTARPLLLFVVMLVANANGKSNKVKIDSRIVGGKATTIEQHPYQVSIVYIDSHYCGGSIINPTHVLTAAHCTEGTSADDLLVRAGTTYLDQGGQLKQVQEFNQHPKFDSQTYDYDISILRLSESLTFGPKVQAVWLPAQDTGDLNADLLGTATGWGRLYQNGPLPTELQEVDLPTIDKAVCEMVYGASLTPRMLCAGYVQGNKDTCQGDSGGPYVYNQVLIGITSWGDGCGAAQSPGVYTKVQYFRDFIDDIRGDATSINLRIVGGNAVTIEEYPYQVSIIYIDSHYCGGSLIHPQYVLTAAHCTSGFLSSYILVRAGSTYVDQGGQVREVTAIHPHPSYKNESDDFDISILKLDSPFDISTSVQTVQLPNQDAPVEDNRIGIATGWGRLANNGALPLELQKVELPTINSNQCDIYYKGITENMFCAGFAEGTKDTCEGDSGGPFVIDGILVGITSWGFGCALANHPGVYMKVSAFIDFIDQFVNS